MGDYLAKLGDRICGNGPMGLEEAHKLGHAMGRRWAGEAIDMDEVFGTAATA